VEDKVKYKIKIEFSGGNELYVSGMDSVIFNSLQEKYKEAIVKIDGQPAAFWNMSKQEIEKELDRIGVKRIVPKDAIKQYQANCKHDRGYITNTGSYGSECAICGKPLF